MKFRKGQKIATWVLESRLGIGGNSQVWKVSAPGQSICFALKILTADDQKTRERFRREVSAQRAASTIKGVMPLYETNVPTCSKTDPLWFTMPVGIPILKVIAELSLAERAGVLLSIATTVEALHAMDLSHRDIKPENFISINSEVHLSDFGLIELPTASKLTRVGDRIGSYSTIAPEMRHWTPKIDAKPSDVYSLAKSLWILLTENSTGFEGEHSAASRDELEQKWPGEHLAPLHSLIAQSTNPRPESRPGISEFISMHRTWIDELSEIRKRSPIQWQSIAQSMFPLAMPTSTSWTALSDIVRVLTEIAKQHQVHHVFFPSGGGLDLTGVDLSAHLDGCIDLNFDGIFALVRPERLHFESFPDHSGWNYFLLECNDLPAIEDDPYGNSHRLNREYLELTPGVYTHRMHSDIGEYRGDPLPEGSRVITRFGSGQFLIVHRTSIYNQVSATYDARHNKMTPVAFRTYIEHQIGVVDDDADEHEATEPDERFEADDFEWWSDPKKRPEIQFLTEEQLASVIALTDRSKDDRNPEVINIVHVSELRLDPREKELMAILEKLDDTAFFELVALYWLGRELFESGIERISRRYFRSCVESAEGTDRYYLGSKTNLNEMLVAARDTVTSNTVV